jgi:thiol-disulfide isomerase/thioredoxin
MKNIYTVLTALFFVFIWNTILGQTYDIEVKINDLSNQEIYLGYYYDGKTYVKDTIQLDTGGKGSFKGDSLLEQGIYLVVLPTKSYFEILVGNDQEFSVETTSNNVIDNLKIKGSEENVAFKNFQQFMIKKGAESSKLRERLRSLPEGSDSIAIIEEQLEASSQEVKEYWNKLIEEHEGSLLGVIIKAMKNPEIPEIEVPDNVENKDSVRWFHSYNYNRQHYFDNIDFSDQRLLFTPFFHNKLKTYFTKILMQDPDTINHYIDMVASKAEENEVMFEYVIRFFFNTFQNSDIMGMDKVIVHLADNYYLTDKVDWMAEENVQKLKEHVAKLRFNLIGNIAQDLKMETLHQEYAKLHEIDAEYTLVYFWEPHCGHCKTVTPKVHDLYQKYNRNEFEVFAVYTQTDKEEWSDYIIKHGYEDWINDWDQYNLTNFRFFYNIYSTPTIYLLDKDKKIIAKRIGYDTLENILEIELGKKNLVEENK